MNRDVFFLLYKFLWNVSLVNTTKNDTVVREKMYTKLDGNIIIYEQAIWY